MLKILIPLAVLAGLLSAQPPSRSPMATQYWWESKVAINSLNLSEAQTKQLNSIQASYYSRLMDLRAAVTKAESNLEDVFKQAPSDEMKAAAAVDDYVDVKAKLSRELTRLSLRMRNVLTADQWQQLLDRQSEREHGPRPGPGPGRGWKGTGRGGSVPNKVAPATSQK
jgi:Spy/CpxP family protein refolding chaperone